MTAPFTDRKAFTEELYHQLKARIIVTGESEAKFAERVGSSAALFKNLKAGSLPAADRLDILLAEVGRTLILGAGQPISVTQPMAIGSQGFSPIQRLDVRLSAGNGAENGTPEVLDALAFRQDWLHRLGINPSSAVLVGIDGDSMVPELHHGDLALIDQSRTVPRSGQVYAFTDTDGSTRVKRIDVLPGQGYILRSDNPNYRAEARLSDEANRVHIIGLVVWSGHTWPSR